MADKKSILDLFVENGTIAPAQYDEIIAFAQARKIEPTEALVESRVLGDSKSVLARVAKAINVPFVDLQEEELDKDAVNNLTPVQARQLEALPLYDKEGALHIAVPLDKVNDYQLKEDLRRIAKRLVTLVAATREDIKSAIDRSFRADAEIAKISKESSRDSINTTQTPDNLSIPDEITEDSRVVQFVDLVLQQAIIDKASDIHFDPTEHKLQIRYRVDGILRDMSFAPAQLIPEITSRVKIMAELDISKTRIPQDGRLSLNTKQGAKIDLRVATLPSNWGEKIVMRVLDNSSASLPLTKLGFSEANLKVFRENATKPAGMILVTGPTGSGKSTTLYSALSEIATPEINIITAEDPIEYQIEGITQVPVNPKQGLTFDAALRTILRADPDIILVGEIRDTETAKIAMQAGLTGHMVFSTLHTNDAASAITRLGDMNVEPFITASTLTAVVSQRLVRRLCAKCKVSYTPGELELNAVKFPHDNTPFELFKPVGCRECNNTGYRGRVAIHEVLPVSDKMQDAIIAGAKAPELNRMAISEGMITMKLDGFEKVKQGLTSIQEIVRVVI